MKQLTVINLGLVALQAISAGFLLSGSGLAIKAHAAVAVALLAGALTQAVTGIVQWRRGRVEGRVAGIGVALVVLVFLQIGLGYRKQYWLHVPIGVALFGGWTRQAIIRNVS